MIRITKLNGCHMVINCELVESVEATPDTTVTMTTGKKIIIKESVDELINLVINYKRRIYGNNLGM